MRKKTLTQFQLQIRKWIAKPLSKSTAWLSFAKELEGNKTRALVFSQNASLHTGLLSKGQARTVLSKYASGHKYGLNPTTSFLEFLIDRD